MQMLYKITNLIILTFDQGSLSMQVNIADLYASFDKRWDPHRVGRILAYISIY